MLSVFEAEPNLPDAYKKNSGKQNKAEHKYHSSPPR